MAPAQASTSLRTGSPRQRRSRRAYWWASRSRDGRGYANDNPRDASWLYPSIQEISRVLKDDSFFVCFYGWHTVDQFLSTWRKAGFWTLEQLVWEKEYPSSTGIVSRYHEAAYVLAKGKPPRPELILKSVLEWQYTGNTLHPSQKPLLAILLLILAYSRKGDIVLDPFVGSGTTAVAAHLAGRRYIGIELDPVYARIAEERLKESGRE
ncbi:MAG: DNA methylase [Deltaproteobacteria bacterium]|nr:DNA methylase [Deltaproteobacteria bacterium]